MFLKRKNKPVPIGDRLVDKEMSNLITEKANEFKKKYTTSFVQKLSVLKFNKMPSGTNISTFLGEMKADFQSILELINQRCNLKKQKADGRLSIDNSHDKHQQLDKEIEEVDHKLSNTTANFSLKGKEHEQEVKLWERARLATAIFSFSEVVVNFETFTSTGVGIAASIGMAILGGLIIYFYSEYAPEKVNVLSKGNRKKKILFYFLFMMPIIISAYGLAWMRVFFIESTSEEGTFFVSPHFIAGIIILCYVICYWIVDKFKISKDKLLAYKQYKKHLKELTILEQQKKNLVSEQDRLPAELRGELSSRYAVMVLGQDLENELLSHYHAVYNAFKIELFVKTSGACAPIFTGDDHIDLPKLKLYYQNIEEPNNLK